MSTTIYHNPRCTKSRLTLELLGEKGIEPTVIKYLDTPPDAAQLDAILQQLGMEPRDLMRTFESIYKEAGIDNPDLSRDELIQAMIDHPILIERPIVITDKGAAIGRPPETVLKVL
ncbi:MAG TPA: arsenate reductase (glutaredoxin) [Chromatiaceae bacterium]|jgi:arsenate reductase|nr:arsenate reductase (glutaredoxin) [Chromatiaceae bacterium]HIN82989.1 arsenate reductase (glutaredoxin) [Chromatiales bacterium]HIA07895.1 arsenate reductase (glutaredoxin) [Chromatiaceae bacterium]HIB84963.1 arsenate reductase (glutaredoxin) [Chromatiaceae bacterium]HIO14770.1 arsenate reductase (glutaredoxin) [Chromatiales bacterium]